MPGKGKPAIPAKTYRVEQKYDPKTGRLRPAAERLPGRKNPYDPLAGLKDVPKDNPIADIAQDLKGANAQIEGATLRPITPDDPRVMENARGLKKARGTLDDQIAKMEDVGRKKKSAYARLSNQESEHKIYTKLSPRDSRDVSAGLAAADSRDFNTHGGIRTSPYAEVQKATSPRRATTDLSQYKLASKRFDSTRRGPVETNSGKPNLALGELQPKNKFESSSINTLAETPVIPPRPSAAESQAARDRYAARSDIDAIERELDMPARKIVEPSPVPVKPAPRISAAREAMRRENLADMQSASKYTPADLAAVAARQKEVGELEGMVQDLNTDFHRARNTIAGQGPSIANTERNVEKAAIDTQIGNKDLAEAGGIKRSINKKKLALAGLGGGALAAGALGLGLGIGIPASQNDEDNDDNRIYLDRSAGGNVPPDQPYSPNPTLAYDPNTSSFSPIKRAKGGKIEKYAKGGRVGDGCAVRGFTKGRLI